MPKSDTSAKPKASALWWSRPPESLRYGVVVLSIVATVISLWWMDAVFHAAPHVSMFLCAIMFSAWFGGVRPGLLAIALALLAFKYYFLPPTHSWHVEAAQLPRLIVFALSALFVGSLSAAQRSATESLRRARDDQQKINEELRGEILERKHAEDALRASEQVTRGQAEALAQNLDILATAPAPENLIGQMLSTIGRLLDAQSVTLWLLDKPNGSLVLRAAAEGKNFAAADSEHPFIKNALAWKEDNVLQETVFTGVPAVVEEIEGDPRVSNPIRDYFRSKGTKTASPTGAANKSVKVGA